MTVSAAQNYYRVARTHARARAHTHTHTHTHSAVVKTGLYGRARLGGSWRPAIRGHHHSERTAAKGSSVSQHVAPLHATSRRLSTLCSLLSFAFTHSDPEIARLFRIREFNFVFRHGVSTSSSLKLASSAITRRTWSVRSLRMSVTFVDRNNVTCEVLRRHKMTPYI